MSDLKISQQILEDTNELLLTVEVPSERVEAELRKYAKKIGKNLRIPGFRPGKAPVNLIIARLGRDYVLQQLAEELTDEIFAQAIETVDAEQILPGAYLRNLQLDPLTYEFVVPRVPEVDPGDYRSIRVPLESVDEAEVLKLVDQELQHLREHHKVWQPVEDRPIQYGDLVTMSIKMTVDGETEIDQDEWEFIPNEEDPTLSPQFDAAIVGMTLGEKKTFSIDFPEEEGSPWAGKTADFEVEIKGVKAEVLPELTDELVAENTDYESVEAFKQAIEEGARAHLQSEADRAFQAELLEKLKEGATIHYSPVTLADEVNALDREREDIYKSYGFESTEELLRLQGKTREEYLKELEPDAKSRLEERLLLDAVAEKEQFEVSDYELEQYIRSAGLAPEQTDELLRALQENEGYRDYIRRLVLRKKAYDLLTAIAKGETVPEPGQHPVEEAPEEPEEEESEEAEDAEASEPASENDEESSQSDDETNDSQESSE